MIKTLFLLLLSSGALFYNKPAIYFAEGCMPPSPPIEKKEGAPSAAEQEQLSEDEMIQRAFLLLPAAQKKVFMSLSSLYQRVYLYGLNDQQREQVAVFYKRGENPFRAIDSIMKRDQRRYELDHGTSMSPANRQLQKKNYFIISNYNYSG